MRFASLPHAQYAAMALAAALAAEQRAAGIPSPPPPGARRAGVGRGACGAGDVGDAYADGHALLGWGDAGDAGYLAGDADPARFYDHQGDAARHRHCGAGAGFADAQSIYPVARPPYAPLHPPAGRRAGGGGAARRMAGGGWSDGPHVVDADALWSPVRQSGGGGWGELRRRGRCAGVG